MKKLVMAAALGLAIPVAGCNGTLVQDGVPTLANTTVDEKALYTAESAFTVITEAIDQAIDLGIINESNVESVDEKYQAAKRALNEAREAQNVGDNGTLMDKAIYVQEIVASIYGVIDGDEVETPTEGEGEV
jgi:rhamnogalacturonyl hydrolase YesR